MKTFCYLVCFAIFIYSCHKAKEQFLDGQLAGRVLYFNPNEPLKGYQPVTNKTVYIGADNSDTLNYMRSVSSDKDGYFTVKQLEKDKRYLIFFADSIDGLFYKGVIAENTNNDSVRLIVQPDSIRQNGIRISVHDANGQPVPNAQICLFNNATYLNANNCTGSIRSFPANADGNYITYKLTPGTYYILSTAVINNKNYRGKTTVTVNENGVTPALITLEQVDTGFDITTIDKNGSLLNGVKVCVFSSQTLFQTDDCAGSIFPLTTDSLGKAHKYGLAPGSYFLKSELLLGTVHLFGHDTIIVNQDRVTLKSIILK